MGFSIKLSKSNGGVYVSIVESTYDPATRKSHARTYKSYGNLDKHKVKNPHFLEDIQHKCNILNQRAKEQKEVLHKPRLGLGFIKDNINKHPLGSLDYGALTFNYGITFLRALWERTGLDDVCASIHEKSIDLDFPLDLACFFLVANHMLYQGSITDSFARRNLYIIDFTSLEQFMLYNALEVMSRNRCIIIESLNRSLASIYKSDKDIAYYSITPVRTPYSKTSRIDLDVGILTDKNNIPFSYAVHQDEPEKLQGIVQELLSFNATYKFKKFVIVSADSDLYLHKTIATFEELGYDYILKADIKSFKQDIITRALDDKWDLGIKHDHDIYKFKILKKEEYGLENDLIIAFCNKGYLEDISVIQDEINKTVGSYNDTNRNIHLDLNYYQERFQFAGFYAFSTSLPCTCAEELYDYSIKIWGIEHNFAFVHNALEQIPRNIKPSYLHKGHIVQCYLALFFRNFAQHMLKALGLEITQEDLLHTLRHMQVARVDRGDDEEIIYSILGYDRSDVAAKRKLEKCILASLGVKPMLKHESFKGFARKTGVHIKLR